MDARHGKRRGLVDRHDLRMRMRRADELDVEEPLDLRVESVARRALHDERTGGRGQAAAKGLACADLLDIVLAVQRILDRAVAGAAAEIAFQGRAEILP